MQSGPHDCARRAGVLPNSTGLLSGCIRLPCHAVFAKVAKHIARDPPPKKKREVLDRVCALKMCMHSSGIMMASCECWGVSHAERHVQRIRECRGQLCSSSALLGLPSLFTS